MTYTAYISVPGYLPQDDDPPTFESASEAWAYLADERMRDEDWAEPFTDDDGEYSDTFVELRDRARTTEILTGTIYGTTPGYDGDHDLGLAYTVEVTS